jgi:ribosomal protein S12 methylthiotransferase
MALQKGISAKRLRRLVGQRLPALVEGPSKENEFVWEARLQGMAPEIDGKLYLTDLEPSEALAGDLGASASSRPAQPGDMATVEITESHDYDLVGRVISLEGTRDIARLNENAIAATANSVRKIATGAPLRVLG